MWEILFEESPFSNEIDGFTNVFQILKKVTKGHRPPLLFETSALLEADRNQKVDEWIDHNFTKKQIETIGKENISKLYESYIEIMEHCWNHDASKRPEFIEITDQLETLQSNFA